MGSPPAVYRPRNPQATVLWQVIQAHWESFRAEAIEDRGGDGLPRFVERAFEKYLHCGARALGFARVFCRDCARREHGVRGGRTGAITQIQRFADGIRLKLSLMRRSRTRRRESS